MTYYGELQNLAIKAKVILSVFFLFLIASEIAFFSIRVSGAEYGVGEIRKGNWARYEFQYHYQQRNVTDEEGNYYLLVDKPWNGTKVINMTNVFGTTASFSITTYDKYGAIKDKESKSVNVQTGKDVQGNATFYIIAGDLSQGDPVTTEKDAPKINKTIGPDDKTFYAKASRVVNQLEYEKEQISGYTKEITAYQIAWDRKSGLVCEMTMIDRFITFSQSENYYAIEDWLYWKIVMLETNLWSPELRSETDWSGPTVGLAVFSLLAITVFFVRRRKRYKVRKRRNVMKNSIRAR